VERVRILVSGNDHVIDELGLLREWLNAEDELRGRTELSRVPVEPEQMGAVVDALDVALGSTGALTVLAGSIAVWLRQRRSTLTVKIVNSDGSSQEITAAGPAADVLAEKVDAPRVAEG